MNTQPITFGVEIEVTSPANQTPAVGNYHSGVQAPDLPPGWNVQRDASIVPDADYIGFELASPVLSGVEGLDQLKRACDWLNWLSAKPNATCALHVHVGYGDALQLPKLFGLVAENEPALFAAGDREPGPYCKSIRGGYRPNDRYQSINVNPSKRSVEFRCFGGTTDALKIQGLIELSIGLVQQASA